jgi:hypothetical protein
MAYEIPGFSWSLIAGEDLTGSQFCCVDLDSSGKAVLPVQGKAVVGVLRNKPDTAATATVVSSGIVKGSIGITGVVAGNNVTTDDDGTFIQASNGDYHVGRALKSNAAGEIGTILLQIGGANAGGS